MVYPSLIAAVSDASHPTWRARSLSVYRFWRDLGYAIGALSAGLIADRFGLSWAIASIAALTFLSGVVAVFMREHAITSLNLAQGMEPHNGPEWERDNNAAAQTSAAKTGRYRSGHAPSAQSRG
jgi:MFS family permease